MRCQCLGMKRCLLIGELLAKYYVKVKGVEGPVLVQWQASGDWPPRGVVNPSDSRGFLGILRGVCVCGGGGVILDNRSFLMDPCI